MRGVLLLALGAGLIWLGLSTAPRSGASAGSTTSEIQDLELAGQDLEVAGDGYGGGDGLVGPARPASSENLDAASPGTEEAPLMVSESSQDQAPEAVRDVDPEPALVIEPVVQPRPDPVVQDFQPDPVGDGEAADFALDWSGEASDPDPIAGQEDETRSFRLGDPTSNPVDLAVLLLESWLDREPTALERRLNDADDPVPLNRRRLVYGFWQGTSRDPAMAAAEAEALSGEQAGVTTAQLELLRAAGNSQPNRPVPAASGHRDPLARAMRMVLLDVRATRAAQAGDHPLAARSCSDLIQLELAAPWAPHRPTLLRWAQALSVAQAQHRLHRDGEWPALQRIVQPNDSLSLIRQELVRQEPNLLVCDGLIRVVNNVGKYIHPGDPLRIPTDSPNVVVDLDARLAVYRHGSEAVMAWEVGIGKEGHATPPGIYTVGIKQRDPTHWIAGGEVPFGHPDNPLGTRWIEWVQDGSGTHLGFHGTKEPRGVGGRVSLGCIRMRNEDVEQLYDLLPVGARIEVRR